MKTEWEWPTLILMAGCYGIWFAGLWFFSMSSGLAAFSCLAVIAVASAFHTSLQHEVVHGHPTPFPFLNELSVSLPLAPIFPYRRYRDLHLKHHHDAHLTDPYEDPESFFWPLEHYRRMRPVMRVLFRINNTFFGRVLIGPLLALVGFVRTEIVRVKRNERGVRLAWALHVPGIAAVLALAWLVGGMTPWFYLFCVVYPALSLTSVRAYAEHQAAENIGARSAIVEAGKPMSLLFLNNNLHIVHHAHPSLPWYRLPALYAERRQNYLTANGNYFFKSYWEIIRLFAFRSRQTVDHPFLYRDPENQA